MYFERHLKSKLEQLYTKFPIVGIFGPRQSGKTTLVKQTFSGLPYYNLENPSHLAFATEDPMGFLRNHPEGMIIDEAHKAPQLFSSLQVISDERQKPGQFLLTGSHSILLNEKISQSLAGRIALTTLLPFSLNELQGHPEVIPSSLNETLFQGFYPRLLLEKISPLDFYPNYIHTYVERDVRQIKNVVNLSQFQKFMKLCAGRIGQILNITSLATECGISTVTANQWFSLLEMSFILFRLQPHHKNFNKQLVKSPKLYFYDTGLAANLLGIQTPESLETHFARGPLFENLLISDLMKQVYHQGHQPHFYFWRDKTGHEVDLLVESGDKLIPIEMKSGQTIGSDYFKNLRYWMQLAQHPKGILFYGGKEEQRRSDCTVLGWRSVDYTRLMDDKY
jgi:predicted AAA+ superfamily ATPase